MKIENSIQDIQTKNLKNEKKHSDQTFKQNSLLKSEFFNSKNTYSDLTQIDKYLEQLPVFNNICLGSIFEDHEKGLIPPLADFFISAWEYLDKHRLFSEVMPSPTLKSAASNLAIRRHPKCTPKSLAKELMNNVLILQVGESYTTYSEQNTLNKDDKNTTRHKLDRSEDGAGELQKNQNLILRIEKTSDKTFDLYLYDGNGSEAMLAARSPESTLAYPCIKFEGVTSEELFLNKGQNSPPPSALLFEKFFDWGLDFESSDRHIAYSFFPLYEKMKTANQSYADLSLKVHNFTPQAVKTFRSLMLELCKDKKAYRCLDLDLRLFALLDLYAKWQKIPREFQEPSRLFAKALDEAATRFLTLAENHSSKFSQHAYITAVATGQEILRAVRGCLDEKKCAQPIAHQKFLLSKSEADLRKQCLQLHRLPAPYLSVLRSDAPNEKALVNREVGKNTSWETLGDSLKLAKKEMENSFLITVQYEIFIQNVRSLKNTPLNKKSYEEISSTLKMLEECLDFYLRSLSSLVSRKKTHKLTAKEQNTIMETLAIGYRLAIEADRLRKNGKQQGALAEYGIHFTLFERASQYPLFYIDDQNDLEHRNELLNFFYTNAKDKQLFEFASDKKLKTNDILKGIYPEAHYHFATQGNIDPTNVQDVKKLALLLEHNTFRHALSSLNVENFPHFLSLKSLAFKASSFLMFYIEKESYSNSRNLYTENAFVDGIYNTLIYKDKHNNEHVQTKNDEIDLFYRGNLSTWHFNSLKDKKEKKENAGLLGSYENSSLAMHVSSKIPSENTRKVQQYKKAGVQNKKGSNLPSWLNALCVPGAQISVLLQELQRHLHHITLEELSTLRLTLFKTIDTKDNSSVLKTLSPLFNQISTDPNFIKRLARLGEESYNSWHNEPNKEKNLRFIIQLQAELLYLYRKQNSDQELPSSFIALINKQLFWLQEHGQNQDSQEKFTYLLAETTLLMSLPSSTLTVENHAALFFSFLDLYRHKSMFYTDKTPESALFLHILEREGVIQDLWESVINQNQVLADICTTVVQTIQPGIQVNQIHKNALNKCIEIKDNENNIWKINFKNYTIITPQGLYGKQIYDRSVFGLRRLSITAIPPLHKQEGNYFSFHDKIWGDVIVNKNLFTETRLERRFENGNRYTYIPPNQIPKDIQLNDALIYDHAAWFDPKNKHFIITDLKGNQLYETNEGGELVSKNNETFKRLGYTKALTRFEVKDQINTWIDKDGETYYYLPRFDAAPLFSKTENGIRYEKNPAFYIDKSDEQPDWEVGNFLNLCTENKEARLVLIPEGKISANDFYCEIELPQSCSDGNKGALNYFEYEVKGSTLLPKSLNGRMYLLRIYLQQKKYTQALELIQGISMTEVPDKKTLAFLLDLLEGALTDPAPKANAIRLQAYLRIWELQPQAKKLHDGSFMNALSASYTMYLKSPNVKEAGYTLNHSAEITLTKIKQEAITSLLFTAFCQYFTRIPNSKKILQKFREIIGERLYRLFEKIVAYTKQKIKYRISNSLYSDKNIIPLPFIGKKFQDFIIKQITPFPNFHYQEVQRHALLHENKYNTKHFTHSLTPSITIHPREAFNELLVDSEILDFIDNSNEYYDKKRNRVSIEIHNQLLEILSFEFFKDSYKKLSNIKDKTELLQWAYKILNDKEIQKQINPLARWILLLVVHKKMQNKSVPPLEKLPRDSMSLIKWVSNLAGKKTFFIKQWINNIFPSQVGGIEISYSKTKSNQTSRPAKEETKQTSLADPLPQVQISDDEPSFDAYLQKREAGPAASAAMPPEENKDPKTAHRNHYIKDRLAAIKIKAKERSLAEGISRDALQSELNIHIGDCQSEEKELQARIKALLEKPFEDPFRAAHHFVQTEVRREKPATLEDVCRAAVHLTESHHRLSALNPALNKEELAQLKQDAFQLMILETKRRHFAHILAEIDKKCSDSELAALLARKRQYNAIQDPFHLFFEWISGMRIREKQMTILAKAKDALLKGDNYVFQLIMAGGKSSVIFSILLETISNCTNKIPCVVSHHSQHAATLSNLKEFQKNRFKKDLISLNATMQDLNDPQAIQGLINRIEKAKKEKCPLEVCSSFPQLLDIKLVLASTQAVAGAEIPEHLKLLEKLIHLLENDVTFVFDEIDASLSMRVDVRTSFGDKKVFPGDETDMMRGLYETLAILEPIQEAAKTREKIDPSVYKKEILPVLIEKLFYHFKFDENYKAAFIHFMKKEEPSLEHAEEYNKFTSLIQQKISSNDSSKRAAQLLGAARFIINEILPSSLSRAYFQKFGPKLKDAHGNPVPEEGEVIPYIATGVPAITKFGNPHLDMCLHLQGALCQKISKDEILFLGRKFFKDAEVQSSIEKLPINDTFEGIQFRKMTGIDLRDIQDLIQHDLSINQAEFIEKSEHLQNAFDYVNKSTQLKLWVRAETAAYHVHVHAQEIYSNAIQLAKTPKNAVGGTGTPNNYPSYEIGLGMPDLEEGTEGEILNRILEADDTTEITEKSLNGILAKWKQLPDEDKSRLSGLADIGGFLKSEPSMNDAAKKLQRFFKSPENAIFGKKALVYLHQFEDKEAFVLLHNSSSSPIILNNTTKEEFEKHKIPLTDIFFIWDELRTTGTDFPLPGTEEEPALCFATLDPKMPVRNLLQGYMRPRGYLQKRQDICGMIASEDKSLFHNNADSILSIIETMIDIEGESIGEETLQSFQEQLFYLLKRQAASQVKEAIRSNSMKKLRTAIEQYSNKLIMTKNEFDYIRWLSDSKTLDTMSVLNNIYKTELEKNPQLKKRREEILTKASKNPYLPKTITSSEKGSLATEILIENVVEVQNVIEMHALKELEKQLEKLLELYQMKGQAPEVKESDWTKDWKAGSLPPKIQPVPDLLKKKISGVATTESFAHCFPRNLFVTNNLKDTLSQPITVFDPRFKPVEFALLVQTPDKKLQAVLLSKQDKDFVQNHMRQFPKGQAWLFNLQNLEEEHFQDKKFPKELSEERKTLLWYANFFNGNADYINIEKNKPLTEKYALQKKDPAFGHYLLLKNAKNRSGILQTLRTGLVSAKTIQSFKNKPMCFDRRQTFAAKEGEIFNTERLIAGKEKLSLPRQVLSVITNAGRTIGSIGQAFFRRIGAIGNIFKRSLASR